MSLRRPKAVALSVWVLFPVACAGESEIIGGGQAGASARAGTSGSSSSSGAGAGASAASGGATPGAGGNSAPSGGTSASSGALGFGGAAVGGFPGSGGGTASSFGGTASFGGTSTAGVGGSAVTGGSASKGGGGGAGGSAAVGGAASGGSSSGGKAAGGGAASGGTSSGGKAAGGASSGGSTPGGGTSGTCVPASCGSHKWPCWKMPNPAGSGLPNPASYTSTTDVVHDNITCLDWQRNPSTATYTSANAIAYCEGLTLGGLDDWRAPTRVEHSSIVDWSRSTMVDAAFGAASGFHKTGSNWVLTVNQQGAGAGKDLAWGFNMSDGISGNAYSAAQAMRIRCVRGNGAGEGFNEEPVVPPNQYTAISADVAQDNYTGLIWQRDGAASGLVAWDAAVTYCGNLTLGTFDDWRLPSVRELATLVDEWLVAPSINRTMFPNTRYGARSNNWYWASHAQRGGTAHWALNFDDGFTGFNAGASGAWNYWTQAYVKCVR